VQYRKCVPPHVEMTAAAPFQHVTQVDDKCGRDRLHMCPLALCADLQPWVLICC